MITFAAILALSMLFLFFAVILTGLALSTISLWLDLKDQLQQRRNRRQGR
jgi:hypothetical protein